MGTWAGPQDTLPASWGHQPRERLAMLKEQVCFREQGREEAGAWGPGEGAANAPGPFPTAGPGPAAGLDNGTGGLRQGHFPVIAVFTPQEEVPASDPGEAHRHTHAPGFAVFQWHAHFSLLRSRPTRRSGRGGLSLEQQTGPWGPCRPEEPV